MPEWELIITGCGTSHGNPPWGHPDWWSTDPRDQRRRSGAILKGPDGEVLLIDTGPDLMHQLRDPYRDWDGLTYPRRCITRCDAVLLTHDHADHTHGMNDLRHLNRLMQGSRSADAAGIPIFGARDHLAAVRAMFPYCFGAGEDFYHLSRPTLRTVGMTDGETVEIAGIAVTPFAMSHGPAGRTTGFRCGAMAYLTDLKELPAATDALLGGLDLLVLDMLRDEPHPTHLCWSEALAIIARLAPARTVFTHMGPEVRYGDWLPRLSSGMHLAWDGWHTNFEGGT